MVEEERFERIYNMIGVNFDTKYEEFPENREIFFFGYKHIGTKNVQSFILIGSDLDELNENDELFIFCSNEFINKEKKRELLR